MARLSQLSLGLAVLGAVEALRNVQEPTVGHDAPVPTAVCIAGNARTLTQANVFSSLDRWVHSLGGTDLLARENRPDVFAYITLEGAPPKGQKGWNYVAVNTSQASVEEALAPVHPVKLVTTPDAAEVTDKNIDSYVKNKDECWMNGFWKATPQSFVRTLNQLVHWQRCLDLIVEQEEALSRRYGAVVITRPDLQYDVSRRPDFKEVQNGLFTCFKDWVMAMPRNIAGLLLKKDRARPLTCNVGEPCCQRVGQSEHLWEFLMGVRVDNRDSCFCGPSRLELGNLTQNFDQKAKIFGRIIRPARSDE